RGEVILAHRRRLQPRVREHTPLTVAEGEGVDPSRRFITPYSLSRRAPSATRSALRGGSIRVDLSALSRAAVQEAAPPVSTWAARRSSVFSIEARFFCGMP